MATVANDRRVRCGHRSQRRDRGLGPRFLHVAQGGVEQDDRQNGNRFVRKARVTLIGPQACRDSGCDEQQDDEYVLKLREEAHPCRGRFFGSELVAAVPFKSRSDLGVAQATPNIGLELRGDVIDLTPVWFGWIHARLLALLERRLAEPLLEADLAEPRTVGWHERVLAEHGAEVP